MKCLRTHDDLQSNCNLKRNTATNALSCIQNCKIVYDRGRTTRDGRGVDSAVSLVQTPVVYGEISLDNAIVSTTEPLLSLFAGSSPPSLCACFSDVRLLLHLSTNFITNHSYTVELTPSQEDSSLALPYTIHLTTSPKSHTSSKSQHGIASPSVQTPMWSEQLRLGKSRKTVIGCELCSCNTR